MVSGTPVGVEAGSGIVPPTAGIDKSKLDKSLARSLAWRAAADWSSQVITWAVFLVVARLLSPTDFGIVGMAMVAYSYLRLVGQFGLPVTISTVRDLTEDQLAQLNSVSAMLGILCFGVACGLAYPLALFFRTPRLFPV